MQIKLRRLVTYSFLEGDVPMATASNEIRRLGAIEGAVRAVKALGKGLTPADVAKIRTEFGEDADAVLSQLTDYTIVVETEDDERFPYPERFGDAVVEGEIVG